MGPHLREHGENLRDGLADGWSAPRPPVELTLRQVEGWALYAERLADEMGLYSGELDRLGMPSCDAFDIREFHDRVLEKGALPCRNPPRPGVDRFSGLLPPPSGTPARGGREGRPEPPESPPAAPGTVRVPDPSRRPSWGDRRDAEHRCYLYKCD